MWLLHGTTYARAERIVQLGPDINYIEPGEALIAENFSFTVEGWPSAVGDSVAYALGKAIAFPDEQGPALVAVDVFETILRMAMVEHLSLYGDLFEYNKDADVSILIALCAGMIQFDPGPALDHLLAEWGTFAMEIRGVQ